MQDFSDEVKKQIIGLEYGNLYDNKIKNYSNNLDFLELVSEVKKE